MRAKTSSIIVGMLLILMSVSSCLDSDEITEFSSNATITNFGIDAIYGVEYEFDIDQIKNLIYNRDSLPISVDTILDRTLITSLSTNGMYILSGDTLFNPEDSVNLLPAVNKSGTEGMKFTVYAADATTTRTYTLQIRVHTQEPDSLGWKNMAEESPVFDAGNSAIPQKAVIWGGELLVYTSPRALYRTSTTDYEWSGENELSGLPDDADFSSIVAYDDALYLIGNGGGEVYKSTDGASWEEAPELGSNVVTLIAATHPSDALSNRLAAVVEIDGQHYFNTWNGTSWDDADGLEEVPAEFPLEKIYATHAVNGNGITKLVIVGQTSQGNATVPWATENGRIWADYSVEVAGCPWMNNPFIAYYGDMFYIFGGNMDAIYYSRNGLAWYETARNFLLPSSFAGNTNYAVVVEPTVDTAQKRDFIWVVLGGNGYNNEVWRGRLNRLGFLEP